MTRPNLNDLVAFMTVAQERSFTRAAAKLGVSRSALSHTLRGIEERLGLRLLNRTTRSVTPTDAGKRLLRTIGPRLEQIETELNALNEFRERPVGNICITADEYAARTILWPVLRKLLPDYPDIHVQIVSDYRLTDIAAAGYDAGVRLGTIVAKDMVAIKIGPDLRMTAVASPSYLARRSTPMAPRELKSHSCINLFLPTHNELFIWRFRKGGRELRLRVEGQLVFSSISQILDAAIDGFGVAYLPQPLAQPHLDSGALVQVLADWSFLYAGYHLYYPSRRQMTPAFTLLVDALRYRGHRTIRSNGTNECVASLIKHRRGPAL